MAEDCRLRHFRLTASAGDAAGVAALWNQAFAGHHGFFPISADLLWRRVIALARFKPERFLVATIAGEIVGFLHHDEVREASYTPAAVIEAFGVAPPYRRRGIGSALLAAALADIKEGDLAFIDGGGAWPYSPFYATLIDGSERSGLFQNNTAALRLLARQGFAPDRESIVMRRDLHDDIPAATIPSMLKAVEMVREGNSCWLDFVFRGWRLTDHDLCANNRPVTRAIYSRMDGVSDYSGREIYAIFGVYTEEGSRRQGLAFCNLAAVLRRLRGLGAAEAELHVYADNAPAVNLYRKLGFREVARTVAMRKPMTKCCLAWLRSLWHG